jgi:hypothetical protein
MSKPRVTVKQLASRIDEIDLIMNQIKTAIRTNPDIASVASGPQPYARSVDAGASSTNPSGGVRSGASVNNENGDSREWGRWQLDALVSNALTMRQQLVEQLMDPRRDIDEECGYPKRIDINVYKWLFDRDPIANRIVHLMPVECWKTPPVVFEEQDNNKQTEFDKSVRALNKTIRGKSWFRDDEGNPIWECLRRADVISGIGTFGIIVLGINDGSDLSEPVAGVEEHYTRPVVSASIKDTAAGDTDLDEENRRRLGLNKGDDEAVISSKWGVEEIVYNQDSWPVYNLDIDRSKQSGVELKFVRAFDESLVQVVTEESNPTSPRFGQPVHYAVTFNDPNTRIRNVSGTALATTKAHWTRVIHIADNNDTAGSSEVYATPRLQSVYNRVYDLQKLLSGSAEMYWKGAFPGYSLETQPHLDTEIDAASYKDQLENWQNGLQRILMSSGLTLKSHSPQVVDPSKQVDTHIGIICIKKGVPKRIFMGTERGELSSSQDTSMWNDRLRDRQISYVTPQIIVPFFDRLILIGVLPEPENGYSVDWPDLGSIDDETKANIAKTRTETLITFLNGNGTEGMVLEDFLVYIMEFSEEEVLSMLKRLEDVQDEDEDDFDEQDTSGEDSSEQGDGNGKDAQADKNGKDSQPDDALDKRNPANVKKE